MKAVFLSDAHLKRASDERYTRMIRFMQDIRKGHIHSFLDGVKSGQNETFIDDLYILGDFFDFWFCDPDKIHPEFQPVIRELLLLKEAGVRISFCEGNHDFFMADYFQDRLGMDVFEEWADISTDGSKILASHGDTVDSSDRVYVLFRRFLRSKLFYSVQRVIPASVRWALAGMTSNVSKEINSDNRDALVEKMLQFSQIKFSEGYDAVILGHCHQPVLKTFSVGGRHKTFATLGDWVRHYSFLYCENGQFRLGYYR